MSKPHFYPQNEHRHWPAENSTEGGKCLVGHEGDFSNFAKKKDGSARKHRNSCNYRYQAYEQATSEKKIKDYLHTYNDRTQQILIHDQFDSVRTSAYSTEAGGKNPANYCATIAPPRRKDWDVGGPNRVIRRKSFKREKIIIPKGYNFTQDTWPYWNNAHHLIPKGTLRKVIMDPKIGIEIGALMEKGLLEVEYNINHKINMLFLPQDKEVGEILDMPRHIQLKEGDDDSIAAHCVQHPVYDKMVKEIDRGLGKVVEEFKTKIQKAIKENCEKPKFTLSKQKLESLSTRLMNMILSSEGGRSLDSIAKMNEAN
ncbi:MAG: AHH domain-containing protein [Gammaproteobacteria bacterium]|nr:AHH domain-containing protein [Gammaproteobacteria bacterium]MDH5728859.1 AHH domain-containing protein [Gammaproteobacteria bacterium]